VTALYWFRNDLRLEDNIGLAAQADADRLLCVYCWPRSVPWCNVTGMGEQRRRFLLESLASLRDALRDRGQDLLVTHRAPEAVIPELVRAYGVRRVAAARSPGVYEAREETQLRRRLDVELVLYTGNTLFALPSSYGDLPAHYTPFREAVNPAAVLAPLGVPSLPPTPKGVRDDALERPSVRPHPSFVAYGGAAAGRRRLDAWLFRERAVADYRQTRDQLEGLYAFSALSPWLANGSLSVRQLHAALRDYEARHGANDSTEWYWRELLWREYFQLRAYAQPAKLFSPPAPGLNNCRTCTFEPRAFARWCAGDTDYPLVNALMRQLVTSGWMSNRGRQIAASCLVNELNLDWRFGAAFFEKHLIDFDVASNYGNWAYIAGVGADPRGGRHFDLHRQAQRFDPDGEFTRRWDGLRPPQPKHVVDAADWPILENDDGGSAA
jgi:deoxyribodipyrimidine photo-lyase